MKGTTTTLASIALSIYLGFFGLSIDHKIDFYLLGVWYFVAVALTIWILLVLSDLPDSGRLFELASSHSPAIIVSLALVIRIPVNSQVPTIIL